MEVQIELKVEIDEKAYAANPSAFPAGSDEMRADVKTLIEWAVGRYLAQEQLGEVIGT